MMFEVCRSLALDMTNLFSVPFLHAIVQAFYRQKTVNLPLIAKEGFLTVFGPGTCPLQHIKSPRKSELGKLTKKRVFLEPYID